MKLNETILSYRKRMGLSQEELAARLGVSRQAVSKWELGTSTPDPGNIVALAKLFGISTDELLMDEIPTQTTTAPQPTANNAPQGDSLERLPGILGRIIRKYSWLSGLYLMLGGLGFLLIGYFARSSYDSMFSGFGHEVPGLSIPDSPFGTISTIILILGGIFVIVGLILAIVLYKKRPK